MVTLKRQQNLASQRQKKIKFTPAVKDGKPVSVRGNLEFVFDLYSGPGPQLVAPDEGKVFSQSSRTITLKWEPVDGATKYLVTVEKKISEGVAWERISLSDTTSTEHKMDFPDAQSGRWCVRALQASGKWTAPSDWRTFSFTK